MCTKNDVTLIRIRKALGSFLFLTYILHMIDVIYIYLGLISNYTHTLFLSV